jgi:hypothetical protein
MKLKPWSRIFKLARQEHLQSMGYTYGFRRGGELFV